MTAEPRQEAERLVNRAVVQTTTDERRTLLNAVLAAAIKYNDARKRGNPTLATEQAERELDGALSALREDTDG